MEKKSEAAKTSSGLSENYVVSTRHSRKVQKLNTGKGANDEDDDSESLSDIVDSEVCQYLNNKKEAHYKRMIWEAMNMDHQKGSNQKRAKKATKGDPTKNIVKPSRKMANEKGLSSKVNYDILNKLMHDGVLEVDNGEDMDSHRRHHLEMNLNNDKSYSEAYGSGNDNNHEIEQESTDCEDACSTQDHPRLADFGNDDDSYLYDEEDDDDYSKY